ncbi:MAG: fatty acid-binding protein DegV, partial [Lachnospiraceae bacterium]|nr:fatty acid-binding protein DegV [Lachnospiraceae bacterium]
MKWYRSLVKLITGSERSLRDRVFIVLTVSALLMSAVALIGDLIYGENLIEIIVLLITTLGTPAVTIIGITKNKVEIAAKLVSMGILFFIMPGIFFFGGGPEGGAVPWLVFAYLYIGLVLAGRWRTFSLLVLTVEVVLMYYIAYVYPEMVMSHKRETFFVDSALGVIEVGTVCFIMTWFQRSLMRAENQRAHEEARKFEELHRSQSRFFSSMSHEIRTPINSILGLNEIILRQEDASEEIIRDAGNIQGAGKMLLALINDILDISKIEAGKMEIVPVNYSMASLISEIVNMMWLRAEQKGLKLIVEADPYLPSEFFGDEVRIKQILINLLNNAVKYTKEGSVTLHIEAEKESGNEARIVFSVSDTGMGIKQDALPFLFNAFQRVDEEKNRKIEGTGLGLSVVKQLVDLMGGEITVD